MSDKLEFREKLSGILGLAEEQSGRMTLEEVEKYFEDDHLSQEQTDLVCDYLMSQKVIVKGYEKKGGVIKEHTEEPAALTEEEQNYLAEYMQDIENMKSTTVEEARAAYYLPKVVDEALSMHHPEIFLGDMIQEGNISMIMALKESGGGEGEEEEVMRSVREGLEMMIESQTEAKRRDKKIVSRVAELDETIHNMKEELGRKATVEEVAERLGMTEEQIEDIMKLAGEGTEE